MSTPVLFQAGGDPAWNLRKQNLLHSWAQIGITPPHWKKGAWHSQSALENSSLQNLLLDAHTEASHSKAPTKLRIEKKLASKNPSSTLRHFWRVFSTKNNWWTWKTVCDFPIRWDVEVELLRWSIQPSTNKVDHLLMVERNGGGGVHQLSLVAKNLTRKTRWF